MADSGQGILRTVGHVVRSEAAGLAIVKGNHLCCCFCAFSGKSIPAPESNICCHYCNQMIPGNKYFPHLVSRNLSLSNDANSQSIFQKIRYEQ